MTCAEFQRVLPYIIETGGNPEEEEHLRTCKVCSDLVQDLKYIAEQAKLLVPMEEPNPRVWEGIRGAMEREGLVRSDRRTRRLLKNKGTVPWMVALGAVLFAALAGLVFRGESRVVQPASPAATRPSQSIQIRYEKADEDLVLAVSLDPAVRERFRKNLEQVNQSISEAESALKRAPENPELRQLLRQAYEQKSMLYDMAVQALPY